jgi:hypothetical protein
VANHRQMLSLCFLAVCCGRGAFFVFFFFAVENAMNVLIRCPDDPQEWCIIELQGSLDNRGQAFASRHLGRFTVKSDVILLL